jgi:GH15 family glucan-1,4-alpha-glucosidase
MTSLATPIGAFGLIGDTRTAALVGPDGSVDWWCLPRFDSPPVFGRLIGGEAAGHFVVRPAGAGWTHRHRYREATATLETTWSRAGVDVTVADSMVAEVAGQLLPATLMVRRITVAGGAADVAVEVSPRFGYRRGAPSAVRTTETHTVFERGGLAIAVSADGAPAAGDGATLLRVNSAATVTLSAAHHQPVVFTPPDVAWRAAERDERGWRAWSDDIAGGSPYRSAIVRSLITLQLLTYSPSGAPVAAPTTSLPEVAGGSRNWDYRFAWPRDAAIGVAAFLAYGKRREARSFLAWLLHASRLARPRLPPLFTIDGRPGPKERSLDGWPGWAGSVPVRAGNGAADQHQLDGYGWVVDAAWLATESGEHLDGETWRTIRSFADHVCTTWDLPDAGIWERRDDSDHHVHSTVMAWLAVDRAVRIAAFRGDDRRRSRRAAIGRWTATRNRIADDVGRLGTFDGSYRATYESTSFDAALLVLPVIGLHRPDDPRVRATIDGIRGALGAGGPLLYRYLGDDGLEGREGAFLPCSFWLVQALALTGRRGEAAELFDELLSYGEPLGLFAEEMDPATRSFLGNYPQALTHAALVQAALALDRTGHHKQ